MATLSAKDRKTLLFWQIAHADVRRPLLWVESLKRTIEVLTSASPTEEAAALFWIRLHGVLHQLLELYQPPPSTALPEAPNRRSRRPPIRPSNRRSRRRTISRTLRPARLARVCSYARFSLQTSYWLSSGCATTRRTQS
jgi:hypothetical protein